MTLPRGTAELVANLKMRRRLGEFKATDTDIENALRDSNNVFRQAITFLKTGRKARHIKGESKVRCVLQLCASARVFVDFELI